MARRRMIDPNIWDDPDFGDLSPMGRLFYIGCFSNADDEGRLIGDPRYLRKTIFGYDDMALEEVIEIRDHVLAVFKKLQLYKVDGKEYLYFENWKKHQTISHPTDSQLPTPNSTPILESVPNDSGMIPGSIDKISLIEDRLIESNGADAPKLTLSQERQKRLAELKAKSDIVTQLGKAYAEGMGWSAEKVVKTTYHSSWAPHLLAVHEAGWEPDDLRGCARYIRTEPYWCDKDPGLKLIVAKLPEWERAGRPEHYDERKNGKVAVSPGTPFCPTCKHPLREYVYETTDKRIPWCYECDGDGPIDDKPG